MAESRCAPDWPRLLVAILVLAACPAAASGQQHDPEGVEWFERKIRPVLIAHCYECHSAQAAKTNELQADLLLDTRAGLLAGGESGPAIVPGKPDESLLIQSLRHESLEMPPSRKLREDVIADFATWIQMGAPDPRDAEQPVGTPRRGEFQITEQDRAFWSFQPLRIAPPPDVHNNAWVRSDLDRFIMARLEAEQLRPTPMADKATLLRRATFDLTGLPPTVEEIDAFLQDDSPEAFTRVVDRLLGSDQFGVRWGRHWLDGVRYASDVDQGGFYRDWVVRAINDDLPYDRFITAQIAGDLLPAPFDDPRRVHDSGAAIDDVVATGMLALAVWEQVARDLAVAEIVDSQIDVVGQHLLGLTLACARCHDHKYDPISADDYYALAGIFFSSRISDGRLIADGRLVGEAARVPLLSKADAETNRKINQQIQAVEQQATELGPALASAYRLQQVRRELNELLQQAEQDAATANRLKGQIEKLRQQESKLIEEKQQQGWPDDPPELAAYAERQEELAAIKATLIEPPQAIAVREGGVPGKRAKIGDAPVYIRGDHRREGHVVPRRFPTILAGDEQTPLSERTDGSGRLQLAEWIASPENPLTARVMVNRVWHHLFGAGIVRTPGNFGRLGEQPTHPELLDWLARRFIESGWSTKTLIREIMLSSTYQQASPASPELLESDPENRLLGRMNSKRLEYEAIRDSVLRVSGRLDISAQPDQGRLPRSLYEPVGRKQPAGMMAMFDGPDPRVIVTERAETTTAPQALFLLNNRFMLEAAERIGQLIQRDDRLPDEAARVEHLYRTLLARLPSDEERQIGIEFIGDGAKSDWTAYCHLLLCTNEFVYID